MDNHTWFHLPDSFTNSKTPSLEWEKTWELEPGIVINNVPPEFAEKDCWICWILDLRVYLFIQKKRMEGY